MYKVFAEKIPEKMNDPDALFYIAVNNVKSKSTDKCWFKCNAVGINKLGSLMKEMSRKAGLENDKMRNHGARKTMIQTLSESDVPPTQIAQLSEAYKPEKHRKLQSPQHKTTDAYVKFTGQKFQVNVQASLQSLRLQRQLQLQRRPQVNSDQMEPAVTTFETLMGQYFD